MSSRVRAIVAGATGYSGRQLIELIMSHPRMELAGVFSSGSGVPTPLSEVHPQLTGRTTLTCLPYDEATIAALEPGLILLATPNEFSHEAAAAALRTGAVVVDLAGSFRLRDASLYPKYYGFTHDHEDLLATAVYGMTELVRDQLPGAKLIANPGCYPTSIILPLRPLLDAGMVDESQTIVCDSKSGVTGAGKTPTSTTHFVEVSESLRAYNLFRHRHLPEIAQGLGLPNDPRHLVFTPHLLPINRGILSTICLRLREGVTRRDVLDRWQSFFASSPLVRVFAGSQLPEIKFVAGTPFCDMGVAVDEPSGTAIVVATIDNLLKGAASQAIQNANLALGFAEEEGLR